MRAYELIEGRNTPCIVVDIQPAYENNGYGESNFGIFRQAAKFLQKQKGPILMFVNADETGMTDDNIEHDIVPYWDEKLLGIDFEIDEPDYDFWNRVTINDKGYGYLRSWMDMGMHESAIIKTIREMYTQKVTDSRELFPDEDKGNNTEAMNEYLYIEAMKEFLGKHYQEGIIDDAISVEWTSVAQLKRFSGAYIMGGARFECLKEVELLMNAFNIKYKEIGNFIY